jgi:hypothetical protein
VPAPVVSIGGQEAANVGVADVDVISAVVPNGIGTGDLNLTVVSQYGVQTSAFKVSGAARKPTIVSVSPAVVTALPDRDTPISIVCQGYTDARDETATNQVMIAGHIPGNKNWDPDTSILTVDVPSSAIVRGWNIPPSGQTHIVLVDSQGFASDPYHFTLLV